MKESQSEEGKPEVRVRVLAAGVSFPDLMMREGVHPETPRLPFTPGWDLIGVVDQLGAGLRRWGDCSNPGEETNEVYTQARYLADDRGSEP